MSSTGKFLLVVFSFVIGLAVGIGVKSTASGRWKNLDAKKVQHKEDLHLLVTVPDLRQDSDYSCGASALQAVLAYWGIDVRESTLTKALHSDPQNGTRPEEIIRVAREYGLQAEMREGIGISDLRTAWASAIPVIVDIQAWRESPKTGAAWESDWEDGHYVVIIGMDDRNIYVEDPSLLGSRGAISQLEFLERWHDYEGDPPYDSKDRAYIHLGLFIEGKSKSNTATFSPVQ